MAGEVDDVPTLAFFQNLLQDFAGDSVLEDANVEAETALRGESLEEAGEQVTLAAEVEGGFAIGEAEDGEDSEAGADGKLMAMGIALDLKDQGDIVKGERLGTGVSKFEWKIQQRFGGGGEDDVDGGRGFLDQFRGEGAEEMLASPCAELVQDASFVFKTMIGRAISLEGGYRGRGARSNSGERSRLTSWSPRNPPVSVERVQRQCCGSRKSTAFRVSRVMK